MNPGSKKEVVARQRYCVRSVPVRLDSVVLQTMTGDAQRNEIIRRIRAQSASKNQMMYLQIG